MKTYSRMNEQIVGILRLSDNPAALYAAARIEELERQIHVHEESLDEYPQTAHRLQRELEAERKLRQEAEEALAIATSALEWYAVAHPGRSDDALVKIEDLLSPDALKRIVEIEQRMKKGRGERE